MSNPQIDGYGIKHWRNTDGKRHRDDGPAVEWPDGDIWWYQHGKLHRDDGPAITYQNGAEFWYVNDVLLSFDVWLDKVDIPDENKVMMKLKYG
jgi:hypothetical protein